MADQLVHEFIIQEAIGSYSADDVVQVLIDDTSKALSVEKNGSPITSGDDLTLEDFEAGKFTARTTNYKYCVGTSLYYYTRTDYQEGDSLYFWKPGFPYYWNNFISDSPSCQTNACDIVKQGNPKITAATDATTHDGQVTVSVSSSVNVKFWDQPFAHSQTGFAADSTSGNTYTYTFTGLAPGNRELFATDANGCRVKWFVNVPLDNYDTYATRYYFDFTDRFEREYRIDLKFRGYSGSSSEIDTMGSSPLMVSMGEGRVGGDKFQDLITGTKIQITLISETDEQWVSDFAGVDEKEVLCEISQSPSGDNDLKWSGFNLVDQYYEPREAAPYPVVINFTNGLSDLQEESYTTERKVKDSENPSKTSFEDIALTGKSTLLEVISFCLRKTGFEHKIRSAAVDFPDGSDTAITDDPLPQACIDNDIFYSDAGDPLGCYTVLEMCLKSLPTRCRIFSGEGFWWIVPVETVGPIDYRQYDRFGTYESTGSADLIDNVIQPSDLGTNAGQHIDIKGNLQYDVTYQEVQCVKEFKLRKNLLPELTEKNQVYGDPNQVYRGWTNSLNGDDTSFKSTLNESGKGSIQFVNNDNQGADSFITTKINTQHESGDMFEFKWTVFLDPTPGADYENITPAYVPSRWTLKVGSDYYVHDGTWTTSFTINEQFIETFNSEVTFIVRDYFKEGVSLTDSDVEIRIYDADKYYYQYSASGNSLANMVTDVVSTVEAISTTNLGDGNRIIVRGENTGDSTRYYGFYYTLRISSQTDVGADIITPTDDSNYRWMLQKSISYLQSPTAGLGISTFYVTNPIFRTLPKGQEVPTQDLVKRSLKAGNKRIKEFDLPVFGKPLFNNSKNLVKNIFTDTSGDPITKWAKYQVVDFLNGTGNYFTTSGLSLGSASSAGVEVWIKSSDTKVMVFSDATDGDAFAVAIQDGSSSTSIGSQTNLEIDGVSFTGTTRDDLHTAICDGAWHKLNFDFDFSGFDGQVAFNRYQPNNTWEGETYFYQIKLDLDNDDVFEYKWDGQGRALANHADLSRTGTASLSWQTTQTSQEIEKTQIDVLARHYKLPKRIYNVGGMSYADLLPYKGLQDENDSDRVFIYDSIKLDVKRQEWSGQIVEVSEATDEDIGGFKSNAFSSGFRK